MLVKCPECGTLVSDKATKCPKCGKVLLQEKTAPVEYEGIITILNKLAEIRSKFPNFWAKVSVYPDNFSIDPLIEVITECDGEYHYGASSGRGLDSELLACIDRGEKLLAIKTYKERTGTDLKLAKDYVDALEQRPRINAAPVANAPGTGEFSVQINEEDLKKMNLVAGFEALDYHEEFTSNDNDEDTYTWVTVNDAKMAAKIVYDLLTGVFKKKLEAARFVITGVEDDTDNAKYNSAGVFLEGKGYGQGKFAYYKEPETVQETQQFAGTNVQQDGGGGIGKIIWWIICIIGALIWIFS